MIVIFISLWKVTLQIHLLMKYNIFPVTLYVTLFNFNNFSLLICHQVSSFMMSLPVSNCILTLVIFMLTVRNFLFIVQTFSFDDNLFFSFGSIFHYLSSAVWFNVPCVLITKTLHYFFEQTLFFQVPTTAWHTWVYFLLYIMFLWNILSVFQLYHTSFICKQSVHWIFFCIMP